MMFLEGVRVLDLSRVLAGPLAAQILGDMGARVLKIEAPAGDDTRAWGPPFQKGMSAYFQSCNRNKASLVLDLKRPQDRDYLDRLIGVADVMIDNYLPQTKSRLRLGEKRLRRLNPRLITMSITGFRQGRRNEPGYDAMIQAESGLMAITGPARGKPAKVGVAVVDVMTGMMAANGILGALYRRAGGHEGAALEISLYQTALFSLINVATGHLVSGQKSRRWGNAHANIVPYQPFHCLDGQLMIAVGNDAQFSRLCRILGIEETRFQGLTNGQRVRDRRRVINRLSAAFKQKKSAELLRDLKRYAIPSAPILSIDQAFQRVRSWDPTALIAVSHEECGPMELVASPLQGDGMRAGHRAPPQPGENGQALAEQWLNEDVFP